MDLKYLKNSDAGSRTLSTKVQFLEHGQLWLWGSSLPGTVGGEGSTGCDNYPGEGNSQSGQGDPMFSQKPNGKWADGPSDSLCVRLKGEELECSKESETWGGGGERGMASWGRSLWKLAG